MAIIPDFPPALANRHHQWHEPTAHPELGQIRQHPMGTSGGGIEFLVFHRDFMALVFQWYYRTSFQEKPFNNATTKKELVEPWHHIPSEMRKLIEYKVWRDDDIALELGARNIDNEDDLGYFIESGIHNNFLHGAAAQVYHEEVVKSFHSPQSTLFYKIHGLVDYWWATWKNRFIFNPNFKPGIQRFESDYTHIQKERPPHILHAATTPPSTEVSKLSTRINKLEQLAFPMRATQLVRSEEADNNEEIEEQKND